MFLSRSTAIGNGSVEFDMAHQLGKSLISIWHQVESNSARSHAQEPNIMEEHKEYGVSSVNETEIRESEDSSDDDWYDARDYLDKKFEDMRSQEECEEKEKQHRLEKEHQREEKRRQLEDAESRMQIDRTTKTCPGCQFRIEKAKGCDRMTCKLYVQVQLVQIILTKFEVDVGMCSATHVALPMKISCHTAITSMIGIVLITVLQQPTDFMST